MTEIRDQKSCRHVIFTAKPGIDSLLDQLQAAIEVLQLSSLASFSLLPLYVRRLILLTSIKKWAWPPGIHLAHLPYITLFCTSPRHSLPNRCTTESMSLRPLLLPLFYLDFISDHLSSTYLSS